MKSISPKLQDDIRKIMEAKKPLHPNQQKLDVHEPEKDELSAKDFEMLRAGKKAKVKEEVEQTDEAMSHQAKTTMKHIPNPSPALKKAAKDIKPGIAGYRDRVDMLKAGGVKEDIQVDETIVKHDSFTIEIKDSYTFGDYLTAAKHLVGEEEAVQYANDAFKTQDLTIFIMEEMSRGDIENNINAHKKAGHTVSMPKYSTKDGKPYAEYTVTDKDEGTRRKYIHHGNVRKVENMGAKSQ